jgi:uncharacterized protein (TIGR02594 family)
MVFKKTTRVLMVCSVALPFYSAASANPVRHEQSFGNPRVEATNSTVRKARQADSAGRHTDQYRQKRNPRAIKRDATVAAFDRHSVSEQSNVGTVGSNSRRSASQARVRATQANEYVTSGYNVDGQQAANGGGTRRVVKQVKNIAPGDFEPSVVAEARRWLGTNPTRRATLWCATFMNFVLERTGKSGTGSDAAKSFASYGYRVSGPQVGAIAVMTRGKNGGHVGVVSGIHSSGNPIVISGNHNRTVAEAVYPRERIYAYVMPK